MRLRKIPAATSEADRAVPNRRVGVPPGAALVLTVLGSGMLSGMSCALDSWLVRRDRISIFPGAASQPNAQKKKDSGLKAAATRAEIGRADSNRENPAGLPASPTIAAIE